MNGYDPADFLIDPEDLHHTARLMLELGEPLLAAGILATMQTRGIKQVGEEALDMMAKASASPGGITQGRALRALLETCAEPSAVLRELFTTLYQLGDMMREPLCAHRGSGRNPGHMASKASDQIVPSLLPAMQLGWLPATRVGGACADASHLTVRPGSGRQKSMPLRFETITLEVQLLGGFRLYCAGRAVPPPPPQPARLIKYLATHNRQASVAAISDALWPDLEECLGRRRLRNIVSRLRAAVGDVVVRHGNTLVLDHEVRLDTEVLSHAAQGVGSGLVTLEEARVAAGLYQGDLLPDDTEEWLEIPREHLRMQFLTLADRLAADAAQLADVDEAVRWWTAGMRTDPHDEGRAVMAGMHLLRQGRYTAARRMLRRAQEIAIEMDVPLSTGAQELHAALNKVGPK